MVSCSDCGAEINTAGYEVTEIVSCPSCGKEFEVLGEDEIVEIEIDGVDWGE